MATVFGLIVAIPALVAFAIFQNRTDKLVAALTEGTTEIFNDLLFLSESDRASAEAGTRDAAGREWSKGGRHPAPGMTV